MGIQIGKDNNHSFVCGCARSSGWEPRRYGLYDKKIDPPLQVGLGDQYR